MYVHLTHIPPLDHDFDHTLGSVKHVRRLALYFEGYFRERIYVHRIPANDVDHLVFLRDCGERFADARFASRLFREGLRARDARQLGVAIFAENSRGVLLSRQPMKMAERAGESIPGLLPPFWKATLERCHTRLQRD